MREDGTEMTNSRRETQIGDYTVSLDGEGTRGLRPRAWPSHFRKGKLRL